MTHLELGDRKSLDAAIAFLLHALLNLRTVDLSVAMELNDTLAMCLSITSAMIRFILQHSHRSPAFNALEGLTYGRFNGDAWDQHSQTNIDNIFWLLYLPKLKSLTVCAHQADDQLVQWPCAVSSLEALHTLILGSSDIEVQALRPIMSAEIILRNSSSTSYTNSINMSKKTGHILIAQHYEKSWSLESIPLRS